MNAIHVLGNAVRAAEAQGRRVRALGANASLSDHAGDDTIVATTELDAVVPLWTGIRPTCHPESLVQVECGVRVRALNTWLRRRGRMLENTAAFTGQTIVGALATASHGTGLALPPMCDQVVSFVLITRAGTALRVEPSDGPTDPKHHEEPDVSLIQDDRLFHCALTGLGAFGLVAAVTLRTRLHTPLWERRMGQDLDAALEGPLSDPGAVRHSSMLFNPTAHRGEQRAVVTLRDHADPVGLSHALTPRQRWLPVLFSRLPFDGLVRWWLRRFPCAAPGVVHRALRTTERGRIRSHAPKILDNWPLNRFAPARASELFVPLDRWRQAVSDLGHVATSEARAGRYLTAPISVRFVAASKHLLTPTFGRAGAMVELVHLKGTANENQAMLPYIEALRPYSGRMHLGLETPGLQIPDDYSEFDVWQETRRRFDPGPAFGLPSFLAA